MPEPTLDDLYDAFVSPYVSRVSPDLAAAHLLALGADGPALRELASLSERQFTEALELLPAAAAEADELLRPVRARQEELDVLEEAVPAVVLAWSTVSIDGKVDDLADFLDNLSGQAQRAGLGDVDGPVDDAEEQVAYCYGADLDALLAFVTSRLPTAPVPPVRVERRTG